MKKLLPLFLCLVINSSSFAQLSSGLVAWWPLNGNAKDGSGKGHHGNARNISYGTGKTGMANTAAYFNGSDTSYISTGYQSDLNITRMSICGVVKPTGFYTDLCQSGRILSRGVEFGNGHYQLELFNNAFDSSCAVNNDTSYYTYNMGVGNKPNYHTAAQYSPATRTNSWYCVVATWNDTVYRMYVDGVLKYQATPHSNPAIGTSTDSLSIGGTRYSYITYPYWFKGYMDDVRLYYRALSVSEIDNYCTNYHNIYPESVGNINAFEFLQVYPNPGKGLFTISGYTSNNKPVSVGIYNLMGQIIYRGDVTPVNNELNTRISLPSSVTGGLYYIHLSTESGNHTLKLLVDK